MNNLVEINNTELSIKEFNGQRVVTFKDIDNVHNRPDGTARRNFNSSKKYLIENEDYFKITRKNSMDEIRTMNMSIPPKGITLLTESGYLLLVKSFTDDLAWKVQRELVSSYFKAKDIIQNDNNPQFTIALDKLTEALSSIDNRLSVLEKPTQKKQLPTNKYSRWKTNIFKNIKLIQEYVNDNSDENLTLAETMSTIFNEFQDTYNIDLSEYTEMYKCEYCLDYDSNIYTLDIINHYKDIRDTFALTVNSIMEKLHIENTDNNSSYNIFDTLAAQIER